MVTATYMLCNFAYLQLMSPAEIAGSESVAADAISRIFPWGGTLIAIMIAISTFGTAGLYPHCTEGVFRHGKGWTVLF